MSTSGCCSKASGEATSSELEEPGCGVESNGALASGLIGSDATAVGVIDAERGRLGVPSSERA
jgi:hypothetical protein